jgi:hypothetical protein
VTKLVYGFVVKLVNKTVTIGLPPINVCSMKNKYTVRRSHYVVVFVHKAFLVRTFSQMTGPMTVFRVVLILVWLDGVAVV